MMNEHGKSDNSVLPTKFANKDVLSTSAERDGGKGVDQRKHDQQNTQRTQGRVSVPSALDRVRKLAKSDRRMQFTNLMHHVYEIDRLRAVYFSLKKNASSGIDGETWTSYGGDLEVNLHDLSKRLKHGGYKAKPVRRVFIAKACGKQRPLGVPVLEDKIVQRSAVEVMNAIYETDFVGFSYGYRPGRRQHDCLDALYVGLLMKKMNWVLDADIKGFFDNLNHEWLMKFIEHRIGDKRLLRLISKWLKAGVMQDGKRTETNEGVPQGGSISPLLANIYLHYVLDLWVSQRRKKSSDSELVIVRWADDFVIGFKRQREADAFLKDLRDRMRKFSLELHPEKTRVVEFGCYAITNRKRRGEKRPEVFDFLGFTHICGRTQGSGWHTILRYTIKKKMRAKLAEIKVELNKRMHHPLAQQGKWLRSVVEGHNRYYGVPGNQKRLFSFRQGVIRLWWQALKRRGGRRVLRWERLQRIVKRYLPRGGIHHPYPLKRMGVIT